MRAFNSSMVASLNDGRTNRSCQVCQDRGAGPVGKARTQSDVLSLLLSPGSSNLQKSFTINSMHGEGIEPPTYWV
jgi:hypothetical protein